MTCPGPSLTSKGKIENESVPETIHLPAVDRKREKDAAGRKTRHQAARQRRSRDRWELRPGHWGRSQLDIAKKRGPASGTARMQMTREKKNWAVTCGDRCPGQTDPFVGLPQENCRLPRGRGRRPSRRLGRGGHPCDDLRPYNTASALAGRRAGFKLARDPGFPYIKTPASWGRRARYAGGHDSPRGPEVPGLGACSAA